VITTRINTRKSAGAVVAVASVLLLSACGASGPDAPTRTIKQVTDGTEATSGSIVIRDVVIVAQPDGSGALVGTFINEAASADALTGITVNGKAATLSAASFLLAQNKPVIFSGDSANATGSVGGLGATAGTRVPVVISFQSAPSVTISAMVRAKAVYFAGVGSSKLVTAATPAPTASK
jgi:hypothetical protein